MDEYGSSINWIKLSWGKNSFCETLAYPILNFILH